MAPSSAPPEPLRDFLEWLAVERGRARATIDSYRRDLVQFLQWCRDEGVDPLRCGADDLDRYLATLRVVGRAPTSVARSRAALRGWFGFLLAEGDVAADPTASVRPPRVPRSLPHPLSEEVVERLLDAPWGSEARDRRDRALLEFLYGTGARVSEAIGVRLEDLDFIEETALVTGKGSRQRLVPLGRSLRMALEQYLAPEGRSILAAEPRTSYLFLNNRGGRLTRQGADLVLRRRGRAVGLDVAHLSAHVLRHSCATHMLAHGADVRVVQELLGHASIATTQVYTAVSPTALHAAYQYAHPRAQG